MSKKSRLFIILAVLAVCFAFLWPSISWYVRTPKEMQALALGSLEKIKDYSSAQALKDVNALKAAVNATPDTVLEKDQKWLKDAAVKNFKLKEQKIPSPMTIKDAVTSFSKEELTSLIETRYRDRILKAKNYYKNSVKLGLDLSGGMNVIVKADLDAVVKAQEGSENALIQKTRKTLWRSKRAAFSVLINSFERTGYRQQGEDRILLSFMRPEADPINSIIWAEGYLDCRLVDSDAQSFQSLC